MRFILLMLSVLLSMPLAYGYGKHFRVTVSEPGTLSEIIGTRKYFLDSLTVGGDLNDRDIRYLWESTFYGTVSYIDISSARIADKKLLEEAFHYAAEQAFTQYGRDDIGNQHIKLKTLKLPDDIEEIGKYAFAFSFHLEEMNFPANLKRVDTDAFYCSGLKGDIVLPDNLEEIGDYAFDNMESKKKVTIPGSTRVIGVFAFRNSRIEELDLRQASIEKAGTEAFGGNYFKEVFLGNTTLEQWNGWAFYGCHFLEKVTLGEGVTTIPIGMFSNCPITDINFPSTLKTIGQMAFQGIMMKRVELNEGLESLGRYAFSSNAKLEEVVFPSTLKTIGADCFYDDRQLRKIVVKAQVPPVCDFDNMVAAPENVTVYVPKGSIEAYRSARCWEKFTKYVAIEDMSSIDEPQAVFDQNAESVTLIDGGIAISSNAAASQGVRYAVYKADGQMAAEGIAGKEPVSLSLPAGTYLVKVGAASEKVVVR